MRPIKIVTPSSVILNSPLVFRILVTVQLDIATLRGSTPGIRPNVTMLVGRGPVQCRTKDKTDTTIKDPFDPIARVTPLMIRGTDLEILEGDLSILDNRRFPASRGWRLGSFTFANWLAAPVAIPSERERLKPIGGQLHTLSSVRKHPCSPGTRRRSEG
jgi:hypothetical protein